MEKVKKVLVLGLGNPFLSDDSIGILAVEKASEHFSRFRSLVNFEVDYSGNFDLIHHLSDCSGALIIDSICTGRQVPGYCHEFDWRDFQELRHRLPVNFHSLNLPTLMEIGKLCGYTMPGRLRFLGIEGREFTRFSDIPSWPLEPVLEGIFQRIEAILNTWTGSGMRHPEVQPISSAEGNAHA